MGKLRRLQPFLGEYKSHDIPLEASTMLNQKVI